MKIQTPEIRAKVNATRATKLTAKQAAFAAEYAKTHNGQKSALKVYETTDPNTAAVIASENISNPKVKQEIERLLQANNIELKEILSTHKRNMLQSKHLPTSQTAVRDFYDILGMRNSEKPANSVQVAFIIEK